MESRFNEEQKQKISNAFCEIQPAGVAPGERFADLNRLHVKC